MRKPFIEPSKKAKQIIKVTKGDFDKAHQLMDKRIEKSPYQTLGYFYYRDVKIELDKLKSEKR